MTLTSMFEVLSIFLDVAIDVNGNVLSQNFGTFSKLSLKSEGWTLIL